MESFLSCEPCAPPWEALLTLQGSHLSLGKVAEICTHTHAWCRLQSSDFFRENLFLSTVQGSQPAVGGDPVVRKDLNALTLSFIQSNQF